MSYQGYPPPPGYPPPGYPPPPGYGGPPPGYPPPPGAYGPPLSIGDTLSNSFEIYKRNFGAFFAFWAIPAIITICIGLFQIAILGVGATGFDQPAAGDVPDFGAIFAILGAALAFALASMIITFLFTGGVIGMTKEAMLSGTGTTVTNTGFDTIKKYFGAILITSIVVNIIIAIGFILCCIPGIIFCYWWMFAVTAVVVEGVGLSQGMENSKDFATSRGTFGFAIVLFIVVAVISWIASIIASGLGGILIITMGFWPGQIVSTVVGQFFQWIIAPYSAIAIAYHYIRGKGYDSGATPPPPGAPPQPQYPPPPGYGAPPPQPQYPPPPQYAPPPAYGGPPPGQRGYPPPPPGY